MQIFIFFLFLLFTQQEVYSKATLEWTLVKFENHAGTDSSGKKCDIFGKCDHFFEFSVHADSKVLSSKKSGIFWEQNVNVFTTGASSKGIYNPITVRFNKLPKGGFIFKATVQDSDKDFLNANDNVVQLSMSIYAQPDAREEESYATKRVSEKIGKKLTFNYRMYCDEHYYGRDCTKKCIPHDDNLNGHFRCMRNGAIVCLNGWENEKIKCLDRQDDCEKHKCLNGARCLDAKKSYTCVCKAGFTGTFCQEEINECASNPCQNGGKCSDKIARYTCECVGGYVGVNCSVTACNSASPCKNEGTCYGNSKCECTKHFYGEHCTEQLCKKTGCLNGGVCGIHGKCVCPVGITGLTCETVLCDIMADFCKNGGKCNNGKCECPINFTGPSCERSLLCENYRCENSGKCMNSYDSGAKKLIPYCDCLAGFFGNLCQNTKITKKVALDKVETSFIVTDCFENDNVLFIWLIISAVLIFGLVVVVAILAVVLCRKRKQTRKKPLLSTMSSIPSVFSEEESRRTLSSSTLKSEVSLASEMVRGQKSISELSMMSVRNTALPNVYAIDKTENDLTKSFECEYEHLDDKVDVSIVEEKVFSDI